MHGGSHQIRERGGNANIGPVHSTPTPTSTPSPHTTPALFSYEPVGVRQQVGVPHVDEFSSLQVTLNSVERGEDRIVLSFYFANPSPRYATNSRLRVVIRMQFILPMAQRILV